MMTPSDAAAPNIFSAAAAVVLFKRAASPLTASLMAGCTKSAGTKSCGFNGLCLLTITQGLVGSVRECWGLMVLEGAGAGVAAMVGSVVADGVAVAAAELEAGAGDVTSPWAGMLAAAGEGAPSFGVHAVRAARPALTVSSPAKARRLGIGVFSYGI